MYDEYDDTMEFIDGLTDEEYAEYAVRVLGAKPVDCDDEEDNEEEE